MYFFKIRCEESDRILRKKLVEKHSIKTDSDKQNLKIEPLATFGNSLQESNVLDEFDQGFSNFDYEDSLSDEDEQNGDIYEDNTKINKPEKVKGFECIICHKKFTREDLLLRHKIAHAMKMQDFEDKLEDSEDSESEDNEEPKKTESGVVEIDGTFAMDTPNTIILNNEDCLKQPADSKCVLCSYMITNEDSLDKHLLESHLKATKADMGEYLCCKICSQEIKDIHYFKRHISKKHSGKKRYIIVY